MSSHLSSKCREKATSTDKVLRSYRGRKTPEARMMLDRSTRCRGAVERSETFSIDPPGVEVMSRLR